MTANQQMLLDYLKTTALALQKGGTIAFGTPPEGVDRHCRRTIERAMPNFSFQWLDGAVIATNKD